MKLLVLMALLISSAAMANELKCDFSKKQDPPRPRTDFEGAIEHHLAEIGRTNTHVIEVSYTDGSPSWKANAWAIVCNGVDKTVTKEPFFLRPNDDREFWYADQFMSTVIPDAKQAASDPTAH